MSLEQASPKTAEDLEHDLEEKRWDDLEDRGMCPLCSMEQGNDVPLPEDGVCHTCLYGDTSAPLNLAQAEVKAAFIGHGVRLYTLFVPEHVAPLGLVWGTEFTVDNKNFFELHHSYVIPNARRKGVRKKIDREIFKTHDFITTGDGSHTGGLAYMQACGYEQNETTKMWIRRRPSLMG